MNKTEEFKTKEDVYLYLFRESKHKEFWQNYFNECGFYIQTTTFGDWIKSPFLITHLDKEGWVINGYEDSYVESITSRLKHFKEQHNLWLVERAFRQTFLLTYLQTNAKELSKEAINELIVDIWKDTESPSNEKETWDEIFTFLTPSILDRSELPEGKFKIYRGGERDGRSWSLKKEKGEWFAERFNELYEEYLFQEETITADDVLFYTNGRGEYEVVLKESSMFSVMDEYKECVMRGSKVS